MVRNLKKKLQQIDGLKQKAEALDPEARAKVAGEGRILQEIAALERGDTEVVYEDPPEPTVAEQLSEAKIDVERKLKNVSKKLDQTEMGKLNQQERDRVAERLGWEDASAGGKNKKKQNK